MGKRSKKDLQRIQASQARDKSQTQDAQPAAAAAIPAQAGGQWHTKKSSTQPIQRSTPSRMLSADPVESSSQHVPAAGAVSAPPTSSQQEVAAQAAAGSAAATPIQSSKRRTSQTPGGKVMPHQIRVHCTWRLHVFSAWYVMALLSTSCFLLAWLLVVSCVTTISFVLI